MRFCAAWLLLIPLLNAQAPPPARTKPVSPKVEKALRDRANTFLQYQAEGNYRKAYDLVAADSRDYYFAAPKEKTAASIAEIQFSDNATKAAVKLTTTRRIAVGTRIVEVPSVGLDRWKLEDGKWMWYHDPNEGRTLSLLGFLPNEPAKPAGAAVDPKALPKDTGPQAVAAAAEKTLERATSVDKSFLNFTQGKEQTQQLVFHNGYPGAIRLKAWAQGLAPGITVEPSNSIMSAQADLKISVTYQPGDAKPVAVSVRLEVEPFGSVYLLPLTVLPPDGDTKR